MNRLTNIGVQLMPIVLILAGIAFTVLQSKGLAVTSFVFGLLFWVAIFNNETKSVDHGD